MSRSSRSRSRSPAIGKTRIDSATGIGRTVFSNGLELLTLEQRHVPIVTSMIWYRVGSADEAEGQTGTAHFLEHLMFKGTDRYAKGEIDRLTQQLGGSNNAMTGRDFTSYYFNLPSAGWEETLAIEANRMKHCIFEREEVELERQVVMEEIGRSQDSPYGKLDSQLYATLFTRHPYRHPILGWPDDLASVQIAQVRAFYREHYHPGNAYLVIVGDFETPRAVEAVQREFGRLRPVRRAGSRSRRVAPNEAKGERRVVVRMDVQVPRLQILFRTVPADHADDTALDVLSSILGEGKSSLLYRRLVEGKRLFSNIDVINDTMRQSGLFWVYGAIRPGVSEEKALDGVLRVIDDLARRGPSRRLLEQGRHQVEADFVYERERVFHRAYQIGKCERLGCLSRLGTYPDEVKEVSKERIQEVASRYLVRDRMTAGFLRPGFDEETGA